MGRVLAIAAGIFVLTTGASFLASRSLGGAPRMVVQRRAVAPPAPAPTPRSEPRAYTGPALIPEYVPPPEPVEVSPAPEETAETAPYDPAADPRRPLVDPIDRPRTRSRRPDPPATAVAPDPEPEPPLKPEGFCMVCGGATDNWVEVDGRKQGYCPKHLSRVRVPTPPRGAPAAAARAPQSEPARRTSSQSGETGASTQCRGATRSGTQCRRRTRDPSGFCYQHQAQR